MSPHIEHVLVSMLDAEADADADADGSPTASPAANCELLVLPAAFRFVTDPLPVPLYELLECECELSAGDADRPGPEPETNPEVAASARRVLESLYARLLAYATDAEDEAAGGCERVGDEACEEETDTEIGAYADTGY